MDAALNFFAHVFRHSLVIKGEGIGHCERFCSSARAELPTSNGAEDTALKAIVVEGRVLDRSAGDFTAGSMLKDTVILPCSSEDFARAVS
jgi:hypothetical protein